MEAILNFIGERWPFLAILIIVVFLAVIATIKIVKTLSRIKDLEDSRAKNPIFHAKIIHLPSIATTPDLTALTLNYPASKKHSPSSVLIL